MDTLIQLLRDHPDDPSISALIQDAESRSDIDLKKQSDLLSGVWELRWSSASQPWLKQALEWAVGALGFSSEDAITMLNSDE